MKVNKTRIFAEVTGEQAVVHFISTHVRELSDAQRISDEVEEIAYNNRINLVVINFSRLKQMTSSFLGRLIALHKSLTQAGIQLRLCAMSKNVEKAYRICKLEKVIPLYKSEKKALEG